MRACSRLALLLSLAVPAPSPAQAPAPGPAPERPPTFSAATRLVQVGVVVQDKAGRPVSGLTADDFQLFEDGKPQAIESFTVQIAGSASGPSPSPSGSDFSNHIRGPAGGGATVILLDRLNTRFEDQRQAQRQIVKFLEQIEPDDRVGLYVLGPGSVRVLHDFTRDARSLLRALARHRGDTSPALEGSEATPLETGDAELDALLTDASRIVATELLNDRIRDTTRGLEAIANRLAGVRGRKNLVWVSSAFPLVVDQAGGLTPAPAGLRGQSASRDVDRATRAMNNANVAIYPVDARGLVGAWAVPISGLPGTADGGRSTRSALTTLQTTLPGIEAMDALADATGGRAFHGSNDVATAIRRAVEDSKLSYLIGYSPTHGRWDGKFHELKVKLRRPGVEVRHRRGYLALPALGQPDAKKRRAALDDAVGSPFEATGIGLTAHVEKGDAPGQVSVALRLDPASVTMEKAGEKWNGAFDVSIVQGLPEGKRFTSLDTTVELSLTGALRDQMIRQGLVVNRKVPLRDDAHQLSIVVRDVATGATGSLIIPADRLRATGPR